MGMACTDCGASMMAERFASKPAAAPRLDTTTSVTTAARPDVAPAATRVAEAPPPPPPSQGDSVRGQILAGMLAAQAAP